MRRGEGRFKMNSRYEHVYKQKRALGGNIGASCSPLTHHLLIHPIS